MKEPVQKKRNLTIDLLRTAGLFLVISAHCGFSFEFTNLRDFDVTLLMFVSGISFALSGGKKESYLSYLRKRFFRLIVPVWVFLTGFFLFFRLLGRTFTAREMIESYLLLAGGILFVWVYRVFFTSAVLNPALDSFRKRTGAWILPIMAAVFVVNDLFSIHVFEAMGTAGTLMQYVFTYTIAYGLVSLAGMVFHSLNQSENKRGRIFFILFFLAAFVLSGMIMRFPLFYDVKYPPTLYYCSYGLAWSAFLYLLFEPVTLPERVQSVVNWFSVHTMDIFMWHIFFFYLLDTLSPALLEKPWLDFAVLLGGSAIAAWIQEKLTALFKAQNQRR